MPEVTLRLLVRPKTRAKVAALEARGAEVVEEPVDALTALFAGAYTVVSAVQGGPDKGAMFDIKAWAIFPTKRSRADTRDVEASEKLAAKGGLGW